MQQNSSVRREYPFGGSSSDPSIYIWNIWFDVQHRCTIHNISTSEYNCVNVHAIYGSYAQACMQKAGLRFDSWLTTMCNKIPGYCKASVTHYHADHWNWFNGEGQSVQNFRCLCKLLPSLHAMCLLCRKGRFVKCRQEGTDPQDLVCEVCVLQTHPLAGRLTLALALWPSSLDHPLAINLAGQCCDETCK